MQIFIENCLPAAEYFTTMTVAFLQGVTDMTSNFMRTVHLKTAQQFKEQGHDIVAQNGLFGQYVYIIRDKNAVVVRLGESKVTKPIHHHQPEIFSYAAAALSILK